MITAAEQQSDGSGVGDGSLCSSVDGSIGRSIGGCFGGSCSSIGSGVSRLVYWPFGAMLRVASGMFLRTYVGLYVGDLLTDLNEQSVLSSQRGLLLNLHYSICQKTAEI